MYGSGHDLTGALLGCALILCILAASCGGCAVALGAKYGDGIRATAAEWIAP